MTESDAARSTFPRSVESASKQPTIYDVARVAGVSHQTVSRYLKGYEGIRPQTRERVERALEELSYRPNMTARSLATSRRHRLGAITHEVNEVGPSRIVQGAIEGAREAGYLLDLVSVDAGDPDAIEDAISLLIREDIAGILALASTDEMTAAFGRADFRVPSFIQVEEDDSTGGHAPSLNAAGLAAVVDYLVELGHRRFFHIAGPEGWVSARNRRIAFERALAVHGLAPVSVINGDWSPASGYAAVEMLPQGAPFTALVASNDQMALGAILALERRGLSVPEDVSVVGFDDIPESAFFRPPLTTLRLDFGRQGRVAIARLLRQVEGPSVVVPERPNPELIIRSSTSAPPR